MIVGVRGAACAFHRVGDIAALSVDVGHLVVLGVEVVVVE